MDTAWRPDIIVGVDFGMTCTGVAYSHGPEWQAPKAIQKWPGKLGHEVRNKVSTSIAYDVETGNPATWGFLCHASDEGLQYKSLFKLHLDPSHHDASPNPPTNDYARKWFRDYMKYLYAYLIGHFSNTIPQFRSRSVDFVFSVPVTWKTNPALISDIETLIREAGFGSRIQDVASVYLTEAEAAAIYASRSYMEKGDVFLVCDAGGGTVDLNVLKVANAEHGSTELFPFCWTEGASVGSTLIDIRVRNLIKSRLEPIQNDLQQDIEELITAMMADKFETFKCSFGSPDLEVDKIMLPIAGLRDGVNIPEKGIENSAVTITRTELQQVFDEHIDQICALIDDHLSLVRTRHPLESVRYIVLSGGLGSSPYVQSCVAARFDGSVRRSLLGDRRMELLVADEPQLAVCHGLVIARIQANLLPKDIISKRCCPLSFGILTREPYDAHRHNGERLVKDQYDKKVWAEDQINWVLKQGQIVDAEFGISEHYRMKIPMGKELEPWTTTIVMSTLPAHRLPMSLRSNDTSVVCTLQAVLSSRDMKRKNRHWYNLRREYNQAEFLVRVIAGTALRFEIWSTDGTIRSRSHEEIAVQWTSPEDISPVIPKLHWSDSGSIRHEVASLNPSELCGQGIVRELEMSPRDDTLATLSLSPGSRVSTPRLSGQTTTRP